MLRFLLMFMNVSNTAPILFVNVPLGSSGDTQQSIRSPVSLRPNVFIESI